MAYSNSASERMDELRFRTQTSPRTDTSFLGLVSPPRTANRAAQPVNSQDGRGGLMRRFTTDSGRVPTISSLSGMRGAQEQEYGPSVRCSIDQHLCIYQSQPLSSPSPRKQTVAEELFHCCSSGLAQY